MSDRLEELFERARAMDACARASFLAEACGGDATLERELTSLLAHADSAESFFTGLAGAVVSPAIGHRVGHYRLVGTLGSGGMGTVYRAHDPRLDRVVALKFLPPQLSAQPEARERFLVEARAAAALEHPNICSIHAIGDTDDGRPFIAMACYEGETLKERLSRGPLPASEALGIVAQLARGLGAAHARGIVHRDVKPANIMLCADGTVRLLDFGVAKLADLTITGPGVTPGTISYMSPEQARGDPVNHLTDLWSLGVVLYEAISGARPFRGGNDRAVVQAILHEHPEPLRSPLGDTPAFLPRLVERLLRKSSEDRYPSADELLIELTRGASAGGVAAARSWGRAHTRAVAVSGAAVLAAITLLSLARADHPSGTITSPSGTSAEHPAIAVLPFTVRGAGLGVWREGMVDLLSLGLDGAAGIHAVDSRTLLARWHQEVGDSTAADLALALGVARRSQARYALVGSAVAAGPRIRLGADVYDVETGSVVGPVQVEGPSDSVLALVDRLGMQTLGVILEKHPGDIPALDLAGVTTSSLIALKAYLEGEDHYRRSEFREASEALERAVRADSLFALAYLALADTYGWYGGKGPQQSRDNLEHARSLAHRLPARERTLLQARWAGYTGAPDAVPTIREAIRKYPDAAEAWFALGEVYYHQAVALGGPEEAEQAFRRAAELQPRMAPYRRHLLDLAFVWNPDSAHIAHELDAYRRLAPEASGARSGRIALALAFGGPGARADAGARLATLDSPSAFDVYPILVHPRFSDLREGIFQVLDPRLTESQRTGIRDLRFRTIGLMEGRFRAALSTLSEPLTPGYFRYCGPLYLSERGMPVPASTLRQSLAAARTDQALLSSRASLVCAAALATLHGDWSADSAFVSRMRASAARARAGGDSVSAWNWDWAVHVAMAHELWRRGRNEDALRAFENTLEGDAGWSTLWNVGQLSLELGRLDQAERAFRALWRQDGTPAYLELARILERTGRPAEAREAYRFVVEAWQHADPELGPAVKEARRAVTRLSPLGARPSQHP